MKDKSWIIIAIMGVALTISLVYSIIVSKRASEVEETHTVTTTSIIEMRATTATIKNTLTGKGKVEYKELEKKVEEETTNEIIQNPLEIYNENQLQKETSQENQNEEQNKVYQIILSIDEKDLNKAKENQKVEISINKDEQILNYLGNVQRIDERTNNQSTITIVIDNVDENLQEGQEAECTVVIEEAVDVVTLPIEAIQKRNEETFVQQVKEDGSTEEVTIETGISDDYYVEITEGLKVGDRVQIVKSTTTVTNDDEENTTRKNEIRE